MAQVKIYGLKKSLQKIKYKLSKTIHNTIVKELSFPKEKRYHRFIAFDEEDMLFPDTKSEHYTIIEIMMMQGRSEEKRKNLIKALFVNIEKELELAKTDIEICIIESPACNWGFGGMCGDEIKLNYKVNV
jgi:phenylpyruvate tautomerase PptA (4-oxalocrotonate tautomerase family)